jgi:hypothetical protein
MEQEIKMKSTIATIAITLALAGSVFAEESISCTDLANSNDQYNLHHVTRMCEFSDGSADVTHLDYDHTKSTRYSAAEWPEVKTDILNAASANLKAYEDFMGCMSAHRGNKVCSAVLKSSLPIVDTRRDCTIVKGNWHDGVCTEQ